MAQAVESLMSNQGTAVRRGGTPLLIMVIFTITKVSLMVHVTFYPAFGPMYQNKCLTLWSFYLTLFYLTQHRARALFVGV